VSALVPSVAAARRAAAERRRRGEAGFTVTEMAVTLVVMGIVFGLVMGLIVGLQQQQVNVRATTAGIEQSQLASSELIQYLRAASALVVNSSTASVRPNDGPDLDDLTVTALIGTSSSGAVQPVTISVNYSASGSQLKGTGVLTVTFTGTAASRTIATYYVLAPCTATPCPASEAPLFTYYEYSTTGSPGSVVAIPATSIPEPQGLKEQCALQKIVAIGINISFFAGPSDTPTRGYAADVATTIQTMVFLRNVSVVYGSTTTIPATTTTLPAGGCEA
jgi:type II secretory pathway pseudopilin PulG